MARESDFQAKLIKDLKKMFPGCLVLKTNPNYIQGIPDLLILHKSKWAALENKKSQSAPARPNQPHYVARMDKMSYASFIYPENRETVLNELQLALGSGR